MGSRPNSFTLASEGSRITVASTAMPPDSGIENPDSPPDGGTMPQQPHSPGKRPRDAPPEWLPRPLHFVWSFYWWLIPGMMDPDDSFSQGIRKITVVLLMATAIFTTAGITDFIEYSRLRTPALAANGAARAVFFWCFCLPGFVITRWYRHVSDRFIFICGFGILTSLGISSICNPHMVVDIAMCALSLGLIAMDPPFLIPIVTYAWLWVVVRVINNTFRGVLMIPGYPTDISTFSALTTYILAPVIFLIVVALYFALKTEFYKKLAQSAEAAELSATVAERLAMYDTDACDKLLDEYAASDNPDAALLRSLRSICGNLKKYRPHLPNYVLPSQEDKSHDGLDEDDGAMNDDDDARSLGMASDRTGGGGDNAERPLRQGRKRRSVHSLRGGVARSVASDVASAAGGGGTGGGSGVYVARAAEQLQTLSNDVYSGKASLCSIHFQLFGAHDTRLTNLLVLQIRDASVATSASLHSFIGDDLIASWSATKRVAKCETKACHFAWTVVQSTNQVARNTASASTNVESIAPHYRACAAVITAAVKACSAGDDKLRLFTCSYATSKKRHRALNELAMACGSVCIDAATHANAEFDFICRGIALVEGMAGQGTTSGVGGGGDTLSTSISVPPKQPGAVPVPTPPPTAAPAPNISPTSKALAGQRAIRECLAYELVGPRPFDARRDQEWMYAVDDQSKDPNELVTKAVIALADGRPADAATILHELEGTDIEAERSVQRLVKIVEAAMMDGGGGGIGGQSTSVNRFVEYLGSPNFTPLFAAAGTPSAGIMGLGSDPGGSLRGGTGRPSSSSLSSLPSGRIGAQGSKQHDTLEDA